MVYRFDLLPEAGHKMPAMINLQQYYLEENLVAACEKHPLVDLRWKHKLVALQQFDDHARLTLETPDGRLRPAGRLGAGLRRRQQRHAGHGRRRASPASSSTTASSSPTW